MSQIGLRRFIDFASSQLGGNAIAHSAGLGLRALVQAAYLVLLSRWMGPEGYGYFAGSVAAAMVLSPLAGLGVYMLAAKRVALARDSIGPMWATAVAQIVWVGVMLSTLLVVASVMVLEHRMSISAMVMIALAELILLPLVNAAAGISLAADNRSVAMLATLSVPMGRLLAVAVLFKFGGEPDPDRVAAMHMIGSLLGAMALAVTFRLRFGQLRWSSRLAPIAAAKDGFVFALGGLAVLSYIEIDKVFLLQSQDSSSVAAYTVAFRAATIFVLPVSALMAAATPKLFASQGSQEFIPLRRSLAYSVGVLSVLAAVFAAASSPLLVWIFGEAYAEAGAYLFLLAFWLPLFGFHQFFGSILSATGMQSARLLIECAGMLLSALLLWSLIERFGVRGAISGLVASEILVLTAFALATRRARVSPVRQKSEI